MVTKTKKWQRLSTSILLLSLSLGLMAASQSAKQKYTQASNAIKQKQYSYAEQLLKEIIKAAPNYAAAQLDLGIVYCFQHKENAMKQAFNQLELQFIPPNHVQKIIDKLRKKGCSPKNKQAKKVINNSNNNTHNNTHKGNKPKLIKTKEKTQAWSSSLFQAWSSSLFIGSSDNINQGLSNETIAIQNTAGINTELELDESNLAKSDAYIGIEANGVKKFNKKWGAVIAYQQQEYMQHKENNTKLGIIGISHKNHAETARQELYISHLYLNEKKWQETWGIYFAKKIKLSNSTPVIYTRINKDNYPVRPQFNAARIELGIQNQVKLNNNLTAKGGLKIINDNALKERLGGDRSGYAVSLDAKWRWQKNKAVSLSIEKEQQKDKQPYSVAFFGNKQRNSKKTKLKLGLEWQPSKKHTLEWTYSLTKNSDVIPLFNYSKNVFSMKYKYEW